MIKFGRDTPSLSSEEDETATRTVNVSEIAAADCTSAAVRKWYQNDQEFRHFEFPVNPPKTGEFPRALAFTRRCTTDYAREIDCWIGYGIRSRDGKVLTV
jgi:hypothetical protein